jgi:hypothetical protein
MSTSASAALRSGTRERREQHVPLRVGAGTPGGLTAPVHLITGELGVIIRVPGAQLADRPEGKVSGHLVPAMTSSCSST